MRGWLLGPTATLTQRVTRAGMWLLLGDGLGRTANFVKLLVLARLLSPGDFGLMGVALVVISVVEYFTELGLNAALVQKRGDIRPYLDTAWVCQLARAVLLALLVVAAAPIAASFFAEPAAVTIIRVIAIDIAIRGLVNPGVVYLRRELRTGREVVWRSGGMVAGFLVGAAAALALRNVWALVLSLLAASFVDMLLSYWVDPYRPSFRIEIAKARELMRFGRWISWFRSVGFVTSELPSLVVARLVTPLALGQFQVARQLAVMPPVTLGIHAHGVLFPALVALTDDDERRSAYLRGLAVISAVTISLATALSVFGPAVVEFGLGPHWAGTELPLQVLAWAGCLRAITLPGSALFMAMGLPRLDFQAGLSNAIMLAVLLYPVAARWGVVGVSTLVAAGAATACVCHFVLMARHAGIAPSALVRALSGGVVASLPIVAVSAIPEGSVVMTVVVGAIAAAVSAGLLVKSVQMALTRSVSSRGRVMG